MSVIPRSIIAPSQRRAMIELAEMVPPGDFAEVGVFAGGSAWELYKVCMVQNRGLHLFDTFTGTPVFTEGLDHHKINDEFAAPDAENQIRVLMPDAQVYVGTYPDTHPAELPPLAFIHCDCDQYLSYTAVIEHLWPLVVVGGAMLFDDYPYLPGARRAVEEHFTAKELQLCEARYYVVKQPTAIAT